MHPRGVAIDEADLPEWARPYFSADQLKLNRGLLWILLVYKRHGMDPSRYNVAQRLYVHTIGKEHKRCNPSARSVAADLGYSENTAIDAVKDLEAKGLLLVRRHGNGRNLYQLAWPAEDFADPPPTGPALCGAPTKKGATCTWKAGRGTATPGVGPCKDHGGTPSRSSSIPQPLRYDADENASPIPQPLRDEPDAHTSTIEASYLNHCGAVPQPLRRDTSMVEVEYVSSALGSTSESSKSSVLAVGELTVRTARALRTPSANPSDFVARSLIAGIPRYRAAPDWVKKRLIALADAALAAGFHRDDVIRYAEMVIAEERFRERQHIPEFRDALRRLGRDTTLGHVTPPAEPAPDADAPWSPEDQAAWERVLEYLGANPDDLDTTGTP